MLFKRINKVGNGRIIMKDENKDALQHKIERLRQYANQCRITGDLEEYREALKEIANLEEEFKNLMKNLQMKDAAAVALDQIRKLKRSMAEDTALGALDSLKKEVKRNTKDEDEGLYYYKQWAVYGKNGKWAATRKFLGKTGSPGRGEVKITAKSFEEAKSKIDDYIRQIGHDKKTKDDSPVYRSGKYEVYEDGNEPKDSRFLVFVEGNHRAIAAVGSLNAAKEAIKRDKDVYGANKYNPYNTTKDKKMKDAALVALKGLDSLKRRVKDSQIWSKNGIVVNEEKDSEGTYYTVINTKTGEHVGDYDNESLAIAAAKNETSSRDATNYNGEMNTKVKDFKTLSGTVYISKGGDFRVKERDNGRGGFEYRVENTVGDVYGGPFGSLEAAKQHCDKMDVKYSSKDAAIIPQAVMNMRSRNAELKKELEKARKEGDKASETFFLEAIKENEDAEKRYMSNRDSKTKDESYTIQYKGWKINLVNRGANWEGEAFDNTNMRKGMLSSEGLSSLSVQKDLQSQIDMQTQDSKKTKDINPPSESERIKNDFEAGRKDHNAGYYDKWYRWNRKDNGRAYDDGFNSVAGKPVQIIEAMHDSKTKDADLPVGKHNADPDDKFNAEELAMGIKIEMEHTENEDIAKAIAKDHLNEVPDYYSRLTKMEEEAIEAEKVTKDEGNFLVGKRIIVNAGRFTNAPATVIEIGGQVTHGVNGVYAKMDTGEKVWIARSDFEFKDSKTKDASQAYIDGYTAARGAYHKGTNPIKNDPAKAAEWDRGWEDGKADKDELSAKGSGQEYIKYGSHFKDKKMKDGNGEQALDKCRHSLFPVANELATIASSSIYEDRIRKAAKRAERLVDEARHVLFDAV